MGFLKKEKKCSKYKGKDWVFSLCPSVPIGEIKIIVYVPHSSGFQCVVLNPQDQHHLVRNADSQVPPQTY